ncbi:Glyoxalase-like domain [Macleaya cordata]|uniref:Glyoxalase-like domain n=1 Tax=Macleaya cordata TaxID=56857 RepID=A0A200QDW9_MACCD|nr:Glyoxalase-like domain [Macleaya cordata]
MAEGNVTVDLLNGTGADNGSTTKTVNFFSLKPKIVVHGSKAADAIQFYKAAFGAEELAREIHPKRKAEQELPLILCAELKVGSSVFQVCDKVDGSVAPAQGNGHTFCLETDDVEGAVKNAKNAGATVDGEIAEGENACCGARVGMINDPYGNVWLICSVGGKKVCDVEA